MSVVKPVLDLSDSSEDDEDYIPQQEVDEEDDELEFDNVEDDLEAKSDKNIEEKKQESVKNPDEEKKRIDLLWEDFLDDSNKPSTALSTNSEQKDSPIQNANTPVNKKKRTTLSQVANILCVKKKKTSVLEKSNSDWKNFIQKEGIEEDLNKHNRSKDAYIEKQEFLLKADYCEFEKEKALRNEQRKK